MSEMDQDKDSQKIAAEGDDELESLSSDEKAAFEKIMAEISSATGGATKESVEDSAKEAKTPGSPKAAAPSPNKEKVAPVEAAPRAEAAQKPIADAGKPSAPSLPNATQAEGPSADPQASLDQIMAEIDSKRIVEKGAVPPKDVQNKEAEELSDDQQAALDQIMAEIGSKRKAERGAEPKAAEVPKESEDLSADQQAALNDIMAEIESKRKTEKGGQAKGAEPKAAEPKVAEVPKESEDLSADQQAALNDIMAEIKSKRKSEKAIPIDSTAPAQADESLTDSQQADLQKIMTEIEAKKARDVATPANTAPEAPAAEETVVKKRGTDNLTMEEFDDELSNLLSNAQITPPPKATIKANRADVARATMTQAPVSANMAKAGDAPLPHAEQRAEPEKAEAPKEYPILKEVQADVAPKTAKKKGIRSHGDKRTEGRWGRLLAKATVGLAIGAGLLVLGGGGYWAYHHIGDKPAVITSAPSVSAETISATPAPVMPAQTTTAPSATPATVVADSPVAPVENIAVEIPATILAAVKRDLSSARQQIQTKISDIHQLKSYYGRGIEEETQKIEDALQNGQVPSYELAVADKKIELGLRAIQRRQTYIAKLDTPLAQLTAMSEQLLFMERRAQVYGIVNTGISGLPIESLRQEADQAIGSALEYNTQISIDRVEVQPPSLETIWAQIGSDLSQKANMLAQRAPLNRAISAEICKGNYERKYLLNALSAETARCLVKWDGKDLYLNGLTELTPDVAQILAQWPGEWISLNSVRDLPAESAMYLAKWPGKRISLNGISALSPEATAYLSQWKGSQLEMVGLQSIGSWENYGTRLFLSEKLRRQLEAQ
jgi:hypothetical protein